MIRKNDIKLIGGLLIVGVVLILVVFFTRHSGATAVVTVDGEETASFPLSQDTEYVIHGYNGGTNDLTIKDGAAYLTDADCPDKLCVKMGKIRYDGESIVCLPHKVVIKIEGGKKASYSTSSDAVKIDAETGGVDGGSGD